MSTRHAAGAARHRSTPFRPRPGRAATIPLVAMLGLAALAACDDNGPSGPAAGDLVASVTGDAQSGTVGRALADSVSVRVTTRSGAPARGVTLEWQVVSGGGGELLAPSTRTDREGRSANLWVLGTRAGEQRVEVRARVGSEVAVLDTLTARAAPGAPYQLQLVVDTARVLAVGDTFRLAARAEDRYGNPIPAADLQLTWRALNPDVVSADASGRLRAVGVGEGVVEVQAGEVRTRAVIPVRVRVDRISSPFRMSSAGVSLLREAAGRVVGLGTFTSHATTGPIVWDLRDTVWEGQVMGSSPPASALHVTPSRAVYARFIEVRRSAGPGEPWSVVDELKHWYSFTGSGEVLFGSTLSGYPWESTCRMKVERYAAGALTDLALPVAYSRCDHDTNVLLAAGGERELYLSSSRGTLYWNGSAWTEVNLPGGEGPLVASRLAAPPGGGPVLAVVGRSLLYLLRNGEATRIRNPVEDAGGTIGGAMVDAVGRVSLTDREGVLFQTAQGWTRYPNSEGWTAGAITPGSDGSVWVSVSRPTEEMGRFSPVLEFALWRIRTRAP
ncbi:MAG TPA: hypothetical protein VHG28_01165 [Longimicrobiaceae bacterium]|nr:hypothetical protein [Longimicrobiaceae bacterium]